MDIEEIRKEYLPIVEAHIRIGESISEELNKESPDHDRLKRLSRYAYEYRTALLSYGNRMYEYLFVEGNYDSL